VSTPARRISPWWWVAGGCAIVLVLAAAGVGYGVYSLVHPYLTGERTCLPSDFPTYPGAARGDETFELNGTYPGNTCHMTFVSSDDVTTITAFYKSKLSSGNWRDTNSGKTDGQINFQPAGGGRPFGTVTVAVGQTGTDIAIDLFSSTCLALAFPVYPGSEFGGQSYQTNGSVRTCQISFESNSDVTAVTAFYKTNLNRGDWQVTSSSGSEIQFQLVLRLKRQTRTLETGTLSVGVSREHTEVTIEVIG